MNARRLYSDLLRDWCDGMLSLQMPENGHSTLSGGLVCPACRRMHGRSADAILPMMYMAKQTGEEKYLRSARALFRWSESMYRGEGAYVNDIDNGWTGITVFFSSQLGENLLWFSDLLTEQERQQWRERFFQTAQYVYKNIDKIGGTINYPAAGAYNMALAGTLSEGLQREQFFARARELAGFTCGHILPDGLIYGEAHPLDALTEKKHRGIDIGYNLEETIPALLEYAHLTGDVQVETLAMKALRTHLKFYLPDGGMDNSFGSRSYKWSWWGSRTSDGIQAAAALVGDKCPEFQKAAYENARLLRSCTHDGLLYGGPMFREVGEEPCVHHTFCHAKVLAKALIYGPGEGTAEAIPMEPGITRYPEIGTYLIRKGKWRATLTEYDYEYCPASHGTGGALTLLWHETAGAVCVGTMNRYYVAEANNMQILPGGEELCLTPRIEYRERGTLYRSIQDLSARLIREAQGLSFLAEGVLADEQQRGDTPCRTRYEFTEDSVVITAEAQTDSVFVLPVVAGKADRVSPVSQREVVMLREGAQIRILTDSPISPEEPDCRIFSPTGGFLAFPVRVPMKAGTALRTELRIAPK